MNLYQLKKYFHCSVTFSLSDLYDTGITTVTGSIFRCDLIEDLSQRVSRNAGLFVVGAAEPAVDDHQPSPALDGALAVFLLHRHMAVDDMARARQTELCQNAAAGGFVVVPAIIGVLDLRMGGGVFSTIA